MRLDRVFDCERMKPELFFDQREIRVVGFHDVEPQECRWFTA